VSDGTWRERLASLSRGEMVALVAAIAVTLAGAGLWYTRSLPKPVEIATRPRNTAAITDGTGPSGSTAAPGPPILVDVAGWVRSPGVYEFRDGDRVIDAIEAAGGARRGAVLETLNLAAPLADGSQILVPAPPAKQGAAPAGSTGAAPLAPGAPAPGALVNVNTATATDLEALPGIGEVIAQAIVDYRTENGPFASVDALLDVSGIGDATLAEIRDLVTV
jgi:competence protein ComEA